jgi:hypothetical protein
VLAGGIAKIPKFQKIVQNLFENATIHRDLETDEVMGVGCGVEAAWLLRHPAACEARFPENLPSRDIPHLSKSIGLLGADDLFVPIIKKGWPLPQSRHLKLNGNGHVLFKLCEEVIGAPIPAPAKENAGSDEESEDEDKEIEYEKSCDLLAEANVAIPEDTVDEDGLGSVLLKLEVHCDSSVTVIASHPSTHEEVMSFHIAA